MFQPGKAHRGIGFLIWVLVAGNSLLVHAQDHGTDNPNPEMSNQITLSQYLHQLQVEHPIFDQQALNAQIERATQASQLGQQDWVLTVQTQYQHAQRRRAFVASTEERDDFALSTGLEREFWQTGARVALQYDYLNSDPEALGLGAFSDEHVQEVGARLSLPLWQNRGGRLSRLAYELQGWSVAMAQIQSAEDLEGFLQEQALMFLDWVFAHEQRRILQSRLQLAKAELQRTQKERRARVASEVDVLNATNAVYDAKLGMEAALAHWQVAQRQVAEQSNDPAFLSMSPEFDLYAVEKMPSLDKALAVLSESARSLKFVDLAIEQNQRQRAGLISAEKPQLDAFIGVGLQSEHMAFEHSAHLDQPQYGVGLNFRYPLGNRTVKADLSRNKLQLQQLKATRKRLERTLATNLVGIDTQLLQILKILQLNQEQLLVAKKTIKAELNRYRQGRSELRYVIQSRDNEQRVRLKYAENAMTYHKLLVSRQALLDALFVGEV